MHFSLPANYWSYRYGSTKLLVLQVWLNQITGPTGMAQPNYWSYRYGSTKLLVLHVWINQISFYITVNHPKRFGRIGSGKRYRADPLIRIHHIAYRTEFKKTVRCLFTQFEHKEIMKFLKNFVVTRFSNFFPHNNFS